MQITKKLIFISIALTTAMWITTGCEKDHDAIQISLLIQSWTESHEENPSQDIRIYRPSDYKEFPPSHFRQVFIFQDNNKCDYLMLAPNDAHFMVSGSWAYEEQNKILSVFNNKSEIVHKFELMELKNNLLKLRRM